MGLTFGDGEGQKGSPRGDVLFGVFWGESAGEGQTSVLRKGAGLLQHQNPQTVARFLAREKVNNIDEFDEAELQIAKFRMQQNNNMCTCRLVDAGVRKQQPRPGNGPP